MNPDVAKAIPDLVQRGIIREDRASLFLRVARGELVSLHPELRLLLYLGVLLITAGAGLLVKQNYEQIGPVAIASVVGAAAFGSLLWVMNRAPGFSWNETRSPSIAFDYILLLAVLLAAADLAFIEAQFTPLGNQWPWHLLIVSVFMACAALRFDSRTVFSLALSTFAAWRGLSVSLIEGSFWRATEDSVRWNAIGCGLLFVLLGRFLIRNKRKAHFEPVAMHLGWLLVLGTFISGSPERGAEGIAYAVCLGLTGATLAWRVLRQRRFALFAFGVMAVYIAASQLVLKGSLGYLADCLWFIVSSLAFIAWLWKTQRKMKVPE